MKVRHVHPHAVTRFRQRLASRTGGSRKKHQVVVRILAEVSCGVLLTMHEVYKLGLRFRPGREYVKHGNVVYVIAKATVVTVLVVGAASLGIHAG